MKTLFNENGSYNKAGEKLRDEITPVLENLFKKYGKMGYESRDIEHIIAHTIWHVSVFYGTPLLKEWIGWDKKGKMRKK